MGDHNDKRLDSLDAAATWLVGSFTVLAAALVALGAVNEELTRVLRNSQGQMTWAVALVALSILLGLAGRVVYMPWQWRLVALGVGGVLFTLGLCLTAWAAVQAPGNQERPTITANLDDSDGTILTGSATASDLHWNDKMLVSVEASHLTNDTRDATTWVRSKLLFISWTGPDSNGRANMALHVPIRPEEDWDIVQIFAIVEGSLSTQQPAQPLCRQDSPPQLGCLALRLPVNRSPRVTATWSALGALPALTITANAQDLPLNNRVRITVLGRPQDTSGDPTLIAQADAIADSKGVVAHSQIVPVDRRYKIVCVIAERQPIDGREPVPVAPPDKSCPDSALNRAVEILAVPPDSDG